MSAKKVVPTQITPEEQAQADKLFAQYPDLVTQLRKSTDRAQTEVALKQVFEASGPTQAALLKSLSKTHEQDAADLLAAVNALSQYKEVRKEARRALIQLESLKLYPQWTLAETQTSVVQLATANPPRFWKGVASQTREEGQLQLILCWEQGYNYDEVRMFSFLLDFWKDGVKDTFIETGTKRKIDERINELRSASLPLTACTLAEGKRLIEEALSVNTWHKTTPAQDYQTQLPHIDKLIMQATDPGEDSGHTFIAPDIEIQEVAVNFIGAWSFGDFGLSYDLMSEQNPMRQQNSRDEWIEQHRAWFDEARPTRMELGFVHELAQNQSQSTLWVPTSVRDPRLNIKKELEVGWSLELIETQLNGTIAEMPMGTAINKETGRHWFWTNYTIVKEHNVWRIQQIKDEGLALQGLETTELQNRIKTYEEAIEQSIQQRDQASETFMEEMSWRLNQLLHFYDALITQLPLDYDLCEEAYGRSVLTGNSERMIVYLERLQQRFAQNRVDTLRRPGSTLAELAFKYDDKEMLARKNHLLAHAEEVLREAISADDSPVNHTLLGELLMSLNRNEDAQTELLQAQSQLPTDAADKDLEASVNAGLGNVAMRLEQINDAIPYFQKVADLNPKYPGAWFSIGFAHRLLKNFDQAEQYYQRALEVEPTDPRIYSELTALYMNSGQKDRAKELLEQGIKISPDSAYLHSLLASVFSEMGDRRRAQRHLEEAERIDPEFDLIPAVRQQIATGRKRI